MALDKKNFVRGGQGKKRALLRTGLRVVPRRMKLDIRSTAPRDGNAETTKHVIVLHGWGLDAAGMKEMRDALRALPETAARRFWSVSYDTHWTSFEENARRIVEELSKQPHSFEDVILVGYSMGGIVARSMVAQGFSCRALVSICAPHHGARPRSFFPGPHSIMRRNAALQSLNRDARDKAHRPNYYFFAITYTDKLGRHDHDGIVSRRSALGEGLGAVASHTLTHLRYKTVAVYDAHWRGKFPEHVKAVLETVAAIERGESATTESAQKDEAETHGDGKAVDGKPINAQPGDILLFTHAKKWNRLITWFTKSRFYHVAIFEGDTFVVEARPRGVVRRDLNGPDGDRYFVIASAPHSKGEAALRWAQARIGDGYDPIDVAVIVLETMFKNLNINYTSKHRFSCGEFVAKAYLEAGVNLFPDRKPERVVPADFARFLKKKSTRE